MFEGVMLLWFLWRESRCRSYRSISAPHPNAGAEMGVRTADRLHRSFPAFFYTLDCREPLPGLHERYVAARWRQTLGSTMHCVAGDGVGILGGTVLAGILGLTGAAEVILEYVLGFAFGWMTFQAFFMREIAGGSYSRSLTSAFIPALLSMNLFMEGMVPTVMALQRDIASGADPMTASGS